MSPHDLAEALRAAHPDAEPMEVDGETLAGWVASCGADPDDDALVGDAVAAWELLLG